MGWSKLGAGQDDGPHRHAPQRQRTASGEVAIGGVAWAVHRGIGGVQVRIDDGEWLDAELGGVPSNDTWAQWLYRWTGAPGRT